MTYILIGMFWFSTGRAPLIVEFDSMKACVAAQEIIRTDYDRVKGWAGEPLLTCVPKNL